MKTQSRSLAFASLHVFVLARQRLTLHISPAGVLLDFPLPLALYKKVARQPLTLRDLEGFDPTLGRSLRQLLDYTGAVLFNLQSLSGMLLKCPVIDLLILD
jgi:HECT-domain (ubiquitin-transferase)